MFEKIISISEARSPWGTAPLIKQSKRTKDGFGSAGRSSPVGTDFEGFILVELRTEWDSTLGGSKAIMAQDTGRRGSSERERAIG
jgi:hypothetical protein